MNNIINKRLEKFITAARKYHLNEYSTHKNVLLMKETWRESW